MSNLAATVDRVLDLAEAICDQSASPHDFVELDSMVLADETSRGYYWDYCQMHVTLEMEMRLHRALQRVHERENLDPSLLAPWESDALMAVTPWAAPSPSPSALHFLTAGLHGTIGYFPEGMPLAYLIATVVTGLGLLVGSVIHVAGPTEVARQSASLPSPLCPLPSVVGRITGMVDCQWEKKGLGIRDWGLESKSRVSLGDRFALSSGLLEITYHSGAKVILQGPVTYEVESNGGYLAIGKLTGKLEKQNDECRMMNDELRTRMSDIQHSSFITHHSSNPQSLIPNPFVIRTPTATVTDLGTEFGVKVDSDGATETKVFIGSVKVKSSSDQNNGSKEQTVRVGSSLRVDAQGNRFTMLQPGEGRFVRRLRPYSREAQADSYARLVLSMNPFAYYRMERPKDDKDRNTIFDSAPGGHHGTLHLADEFGGDPWRAGRFGDSISSIARDRGDYVDVPNFPGTDNNQLSVSAWVFAYATGLPAMIACECYEPVSVAEAGKNWQFLLGSGFSEGHDLVAYVNQRNGFLTAVREGASKPLSLVQWQHVGFVADGSVLRLYRNGVEVASTPCNGVCSSPSIKHLGIGCMCFQRSSVVPADFWPGRIDELAIFYHALSPGQMKQLWEGSSCESRSQVIGREVQP